MSKTISTNTLNQDRIITVDYWREKYQELKKDIAASGESEIGLLVKADSFYDSRKGLLQHNNVLAGRAGLEVTKRVVDALEAGLKKKKRYLSKITQA